MRAPRTVRGRLLVVALPLALLGVACAPHLLRRVPWFAVSRVEVSGARLLAPHEVLAASGAAPSQNVWDDPAGWERALREHPVIAAATVSRRFPATLRIRIREREPAALVQAGTLRPVTPDGALLPLDPARAPVDLPLARLQTPLDSARRVADPRDRALLAEVGRLMRLDAPLMARVSEVRSVGQGQLLLSMSEPAAEVRLPAGAGGARLAQLRAALLEIGRRHRDVPAGAPPVHLDLRFRDQIVVYPPHASRRIHAS